MMPTRCYSWIAGVRWTCAPCRFRNLESSAAAVLHKVRIAAVMAVLLLGVAATAANISIQLEAGTFREPGLRARAARRDAWASQCLAYAGEAHAQPLLGSAAVPDW